MRAEFRGAPLVYSREALSTRVARVSVNKILRKARALPHPKELRTD